ncbi:MAG TPA: dihydroorotate dehydrogenase electron transfer subunit [Clostridia bacterium]|nr:dihydroorotate dehydrogenase electron transfer subunit [Clostridia bacterium]HPZ51859.1 dihydroorotate dehydrogenase electron transfer subunit [Clostridia bacterium]
MKTNYLCRVEELKRLTDTIWLLELEASNIREAIKPGQFFHVKCDDGYLRRPFSVCDFKEGILKIAFEARGKGTKALSKVERGDNIDVLGPLGNGFDIGYDRICVVGGGIGVFPLLYLLNKSESLRKDAVLGFLCKDKVVLENEFANLCDNLVIACDDGSYGVRGFVTTALEKHLEKHDFDIVYTCGPSIMMKKVYEICKKHNIPCQVSLEERMGCGIGACLVCVCEVKKDKVLQNKRVCKDGPVMWANEVYYD